MASPDRIELRRGGGQEGRGRGRGRGGEGRGEGEGGRAGKGKNNSLPSLSLPESFHSLSSDQADPAGLAWPGPNQTELRRAGEGRAEGEGEGGGPGGG